MGQNPGLFIASVFATYFFPRKMKEKTWNLTISGLLWLRRQDSNLRPPGYELLWSSNPLQCKGFTHILPPKSGENQKAKQVCSPAQKRTFTEMGRNLGQSWFGQLNRCVAINKEKKSSVLPTPQRLDKQAVTKAFQIWVSNIILSYCWNLTPQPFGLFPIPHQIVPIRAKFFRDYQDI